ncbi:MAG: CvpA family protein [Defluviitaleaceae bacterium]|nr:CvpA family protein [Defluviitaleaceae bacterium]
MNYLDLGIAAVVVLCALIGWYRGLIRTVYRLVSFFAAIVLAQMLRPYVSGFLRETDITYRVRGGVERGLGELEYAAGLPGELPPVMTEMPADFLTYLAIDAIAIVSVFFIVFTALLIIGSALNIVSKLPVISTLNELGGLLAGMVFGAGISWLVLIVLSIFTGEPAVLVLLEGSLAARVVLGLS